MGGMGWVLEVIMVVWTNAWKPPSFHGIESLAGFHLLEVVVDTNLLKFGPPRVV